MVISFKLFFCLLSLTRHWLSKRSSALLTSFQCVMSLWFWFKKRTLYSKNNLHSGCLPPWFWESRIITNEDSYNRESSAFTTFKLLQDEILPVTHLLKSQYDVIALLTQIHGDSQERFFHKTKQETKQKTKQTKT